MTPQALARLLKQYDPKPIDKREGGKVAKGYIRSDFQDAWLRYLPTPPDPAATSQQVNENGCETENPVRNTPPDVADAQTDVSPINTGENGECSGVAARKPDPDEKPTIEAKSQADLLAADPDTDRPRTRPVRPDEGDV